AWAQGRGRPAAGPGTAAARGPRRGPSWTAPPRRRTAGPATDREAPRARPGGPRRRRGRPTAGSSGSGPGTGRSGPTPPSKAPRRRRRRRRTRRRSRQTATPRTWPNRSGTSGPAAPRARRRRRLGLDSGSLPGLRARGSPGRDAVLGLTLLGLVERLDLVRHDRLGRLAHFPHDVTVVGAEVVVAERARGRLEADGAERVEQQPRAADGQLRQGQPDDAPQVHGGDR